ncbi:MAG: DJ-1/PfpI family protein [bacterium]|nr:DJ-1/PfpI family protein [bacterium]
MLYFILFVFLLADLKVYTVTKTINSPLTTKETLKGKNILMVIAHNNFRDDEYQIPREFFEDLGAKLVVASSDTTPAIGMFKLKVKPDILLTQVTIADFDALVFVGGSGITEYWDSKEVHTLVDIAFKSNKVVGAICIAPIILARAGILKGKKATVWESVETKRIFNEEGVKYTRLPVVTSGNIVTANGPQAAKLFTESIVNLLIKGNEGCSSKSKEGKLRD